MFMKTLILLFSLFTGNAFAAKDFICKPSFVKNVVKEVLERNRKNEVIHHWTVSNDKNRHCAVSCILTFRCFSTDVLAIGIAKEIYDMFTPGDADFKDIQADYRGIRLVLSGRARDKRDCYQQCDSHYPF
jgi:hypothetical protein